MSFSYAAYQSILETLLSTRISVTFPERNQTYAPRFIMRHDIDYGLEYLGEIPSIEASIGVRATYFVQIRSDWYNPFSPVQADAIERSLALGHRLGLHVNCPCDADSREASSQIETEMEILQREFGSVDAVSFHQPPCCILENKVKIRHINTYDREDMQGFTYVSDSCQKWSRGDPVTLFRLNPRESYQVLTHPFLWGRGEPFADIAVKSIIQKAEALYTYLVAHTSEIRGPRKCVFASLEKEGNDL